MALANVAFILPGQMPVASQRVAGDISTSLPQASHSGSSLSTVATLVGLSAACMVARRRSQVNSKTSMNNLAKSPGYNPQPEWGGRKTAFSGLTGAQAPLEFWDPLGLTLDRNVEKFVRRREVELKHGRVAMIATIGYIVPEYFKFPGYLAPSMDLKFADVPNGLAALSKVPTAGIAQIVAFAGFLELYYNKPYGEPGNYGKGYFGLGSVGVNVSIQDPVERDRKLNIELANGRLAMFAIIGMFFQDGLTGSAWGDWALYTGSPLRASRS